MKVLLIAYLSLIGIFIDNAQAQTADPAEYLSAEMELAGDGGSEPALQKLRLLSIDQQNAIVEALISKVQAISSSPIPKPYGNSSYIRVTGGILYYIGTDEQIIRAFGALSNFGHLEPDAAAVLASCKESGGVEIIQKLAEKRLPELESAINPKNEEEKAQSNDIVIPFYELVLRLDGARNPEGPRAAKRLRDQVAARYVSEKGKLFVSLLDKDMAKARKRIDKERANAEPLKPKTNTSPRREPEVSSQNVHTPAQTHKQKEHRVLPLPKVAAFFALIMALTTVGWHFFKKRGF